MTFSKLRIPSLVQVLAACACWLAWTLAYHYDLVQWQYGCIDKFCNPSINPIVQWFGTIFIRGNRASSSAEFVGWATTKCHAWKEGGFYLMNLEQTRIIMIYLLVVHYWPPFIQAVRRALNWVSKLRFCMNLSAPTTDALRLCILLFMYTANFLLCDNKVQNAMQSSDTGTEYLGKFFLDHALLILLLVILYRSGLRMVTEGNNILGSFYIENATLFLFPATLAPVWSYCNFYSPLFLVRTSLIFDCSDPHDCPHVSWL